MYMNNQMTAAPPRCGFFLHPGAATVSLSGDLLVCGLSPSKQRRVDRTRAATVMWRRDDSIFNPVVLRHGVEALDIKGLVFVLVWFVESFLGSIAASPQRGCGADDGIDPTRNAAT